MRGKALLYHASLQHCDCTYCMHIDVYTCMHVCLITSLKVYMHAVMMFTLTPCVQTQQMFDFMVYHQNLVIDYKIKHNFGGRP